MNNITSNVTIEDSQKRRATPQYLAWRRFVSNPTGVVATMVILIVISSAIFAPWISPYDPTEIHISDRLLPPFWDKDGSTRYLLGTDQVGRDVLSRLIWGSRISLFVGFGAVLLGGFVGTLLGLISGYAGGVFDSIFMTFVDIMLALPALLLAIALVAIIGPGLLNLIIVLALLEWARYARVVRGETLSVKEKDFILASRSVGANFRRIIIQHIFPNVLHSVIVLASLRIATVILAEASLSFLGLGVVGDIPSWGSMIAQGREVISRAWWLPTIPGLAIFIVTMSVNLVGDRIRDILDPKVS